jgi:hypothetical protein
MRGAVLRPGGIAVGAPCAKSSGSTAVSSLTGHKMGKAIGAGDAGGVSTKSVAPADSWIS